MNTVDTLTYYGYKFQVKVITALFTDKLFLQQVQDILRPDYFDSEANKWIVSSIVEYATDYKTTPSLEVLKVKIQQDPKIAKNDLLRSEIVEKLREAWNLVKSEDLPFIKEKTIEFCKNQEIKAAILKSADLLKDGNYEKIKSEIDRAMKVGLDKNVGHEYNTDITSRYEATIRNVRPTPWDVLNEITGGGLGKGELGVLVAPPGIGKSWMLINIGAHALQKGLNVLHYTMELSDGYVGLRYDSVITGIINQDLKYHISEVTETVNNLKGKLIVKYYPTRSVSVIGIKAHIEKCMMTGFKPDLVIIDYADLLRGNGSEKRHEELELVYEDLRGLAGEYEVPVWTASQANRCLSLDTIVDVNGKGKIPIKKVNVGDLINTHNGYKKVTEVFPSETQAVYKIKLKNGMEIKCSAKHEFPVSHGKLKSISTGLKAGDKLFVKKL